jgi:6-phosphofructokinase 1
MQTTIQSLGECRFRSPLQHLGPLGIQFKTPEDRVLFDHSLAETARTFAKGEAPISFEMAGAREQIFFDPSRVTAGIVTCGGLCPGLNDVIRGIVGELFNRYGVQTIYGFRYGYEGLVPRYGHTPMSLRPDQVANIHSAGGTILGTSRGQQDTGEMVDTLEEMKVDLLFVIGGDGSLRGAMDLCREIERRGLRKSVVGIPKTIDNDIMFLDKSFGFETAFAEAVKTVECAYIESLGSPNGIGLVKLMGRDSGFIACFAALASNAVNFVLIPEIPFQLEGPRGLLEALRYHLAKRKHAVIIVAEGAGQDLVAEESGSADASGNRHLGDIGLFLKKRIVEFCASRRVDVNLKYIDPSYTIRSVPASPQDNVYCSYLAQLSVHAAMAGKTGMLVGRWHGAYVHLPLDLVTKGRRKVSAQDDLWLAVLAATGQPASFC